MPKSADLDSFDRKLLDAMQRDAQQPMATLADAVGLSVPACYRRLRRLRETGVITREIAVVRPKALGWPLSMLVMITLERENAHTIAEIVEFLRDEPEVIEAWNVTGDYDIAVRMIARDMEGYDETVRRLFAADARIRSFQTLVIIRQVKELGPIPAS